MKRGIYILANDAVSEQSIALLNSIRHYDSSTPVFMIPYNEHYQELAAILSQDYGVEVYADCLELDRLYSQLDRICGEDFLARRNLLRKLACWFGPLDEFLFIDTDIIVFDKIINQLDYLSNYDFICCDYQHLTGIDQVFMPEVLDHQLFKESELKDVFNSGFWGGRKGVITEQDFVDIFTECADHPEYFFQYNSDQTLLNYLVLRKIERRFNIVHRSGGCPGNWAGSQFNQLADRLIDSNSNQPLMFLHWAGLPIQPGGPYWKLWSHYRNLQGAKPDESLYRPASNDFGQRTLAKLKSWL
jgi:hypothetical protein